MFQIVPCHYRPIQKISWKSIHPFYSNIANRHPAAPGWAGCLLATLCRARYIIKMFYDVVTKTDSWNRQKSILDPRDYSQHPENVLDGSLANALTFLQISWNLFICFCVIMLTYTDLLQKIKKKPCIHGFKGSTQNILSDCSLYQFRLILKMSWKFFPSFFRIIADRQAN